MTWEQADLKLVYYAFGGGLGHLVRAVSLARQVIRQAAGPVWQTILINTPFSLSARRLVANLPGVTLISLAPFATVPAAHRFVRSQLEDLDPDCLIVDSFPRGLTGEFARKFDRRDCRQHLLVGRYLVPEYVQRFGLQEFVRTQYDHVLIPGEPSLWESLSNAVQLAPFLIRSSRELLSLPAALEVLHLHKDQRCLLFVASGKQDECLEIAELARQLFDNPSPDLPPIRLAWPVDFRQPYEADWVVHPLPVMDVLPLASVVVGNAGYNLWHEVHSLGIPAVLIGRQRLYDDQFRRATTESSPLNPERLLSLVRARMDWNRPANCDWENGAEMAASLLLKWVA